MIFSRSRLSTLGFLRQRLYIATPSRKCTSGSETFKIPSRSALLLDLQSGDEFDVLIIGGGATGAGAALDARLRGLKVACVEREDFSCKSQISREKICTSMFCELPFT